MGKEGWVVVAIILVAIRMAMSTAALPGRSLMPPRPRGCHCACRMPGGVVALFRGAARD